MADTVRFGGRPGPAGWVFELSGGHTALDFVNTIDERLTERPRELLPDYAALLGWSTQAGLLLPEEPRRLGAEAARRPAAAQACLRRARSLREALFDVFSAAAAGGPMPRRGLAVLNAALPGALSRMRLRASVDGAAWTLEHPQGALDPMLPPVVRAAADLLASPERQRVRRCQGAGCAWLFLDTSRNGSRRWCDMTVCGNRAKVRRHRKRAAASRRRGA